MKFKSFSTFALVSTAVLGAAMLPLGARAADNADVTVDIETAAGITAVTQQDMDFGHWLIGVHTGDTPKIVLTPAGAISTSTVGTSQLLQLGGTEQEAQIKVTLPTGADGLTVQMTRGAITNFVDTSISLGTITYANSDNAGQTGTLLEADPGKPITITTGATGATVSFGGTVTATATPAGDGITHSASFNVSFAY